MNIIKIIGIIIIVLVVILIIDAILKFCKNILAIDKVAQKIQKMRVDMPQQFARWDSEINTSIDRLEAQTQAVVMANEELDHERDIFIQRTQDTLQVIDNVFDSFILLSNILDEPEGADKQNRITTLRNHLQFNIDAINQHVEELHKLDFEQHKSDEWDLE